MWSFFNRIIYNCVERPKTKPVSKFQPLPDTFWVFSPLDFFNLFKLVKGCYYFTWKLYNKYSLFLLLIIIIFWKKLNDYKFRANRIHFALVLNMLKIRIWIKFREFVWCVYDTILQRITFWNDSFSHSKRFFLNLELSNKGYIFVVIN